MQVQKHVEVPVIETIEKVIEAGMHAVLRGLVPRQLLLQGEGLGLRVHRVEGLGFRVQGWVYRV